MRHTSYSRAPTRRGIALLMALVALAVLFLIMSLVAWQSIAGRRLLARREEQLQCRCLAESGLELAAARLLTTASGYQGESLAIIPRSQVHIAVQPVAGRVDEFEVTCQAYFPTDVPRPNISTGKRRFRRRLDKTEVRLEVVPSPQR
jgi:hypothetical protein